MKKKTTDLKKTFRKSNALSTLASSKRHLKLIELKIIAALALKIDPETETFKDYTFTVPELAEQINCHDAGKFYKELDDTMKSLMSHNFLIYDEHNNEFIRTHWIQTAIYRTDKKTVTLCLDHRLKNHFLQLRSRFVQMGIEYLTLSSKHSMFLYELLTGRAWEQERNPDAEIYYSLDELRKQVGLSKDDYILYSHFKHRILMTAQKELPKKTPLSFDFEEVKRGRQVIGIRFKIFRKNAGEQPQDPRVLDVKPNTLVKKFTAFLIVKGLTKAQCKKLSLDELTEAEFNAIVRYADGVATVPRTDGEPSNYPAILYNAFINRKGLDQIDMIEKMRDSYQKKERERAKELHEIRRRAEQKMEAKK